MTCFVVWLMLKFASALPTKPLVSLRKRLLSILMTCANPQLKANKKKTIRTGFIQGHEDTTYLIFRVYYSLFRVGTTRP
jgi:hypothetical protein